MRYICYNWFPTIADHCLDCEESAYTHCGVSRLHDKILVPDRVLDNETVFVKSDFIYNGLFQGEILPKIKSRFTLISGISSLPVGDGASIRPILENDLVENWFCTNPPVLEGKLPSKVVPLPIGFEEKEREGGDQKIIHRRRLERIPFEEKKDRILLPHHNFGTNISRRELFEKIASLHFVDTQENKLTWEEYIKLVDRYKFVIGLEGSGHDIHRNYDALLVDTVPINKRNIIEKLFGFHEIPGIFIESWDNLNADKFGKILNLHHDFEKSGKFLHIDYHKSLIEKFKTEDN
jgi:hypothetical protein